MILSTHYRLYNPTMVHNCRIDYMYSPLCVYKRARRIVVESCFMDSLSIITHDSIISILPDGEIHNLYVIVHNITAYAYYKDDYSFNLLDNIVSIALANRYYAIGANGQLYIIPKN